MTTLREDVAALARRTAEEFNKIREEIEGIEGGGGGSGGPTTAENTSYGNYGYDNVAEALDSLLYEPITIGSFTNNVGTKEMGTVVDTVKFNWTTNKTPTSLSLAGETLDPTAKEHTLNKQGISTAKSWTLKAVDEKGTAASKNTSVSFLNAVYWGIGSVGADSVDSDFIKGLSKQLASARTKTFTVSPGAGLYIYYAYPSRFGAATFFVGGFEGGFDYFTEIDFTNASGYTEKYTVYRSTNANLGTTEVIVK